MRVAHGRGKWLAAGKMSLCCTLAGCVQPVAEKPEPPIELPPTTVSAPAAQPPPIEETKPLPARRFLMVQGPVKVDGVKAVEGVEFSESAIIETGKDGQAILTIGKGSVLDVRPLSKIVFGESARAKVSIKLLMGALGSVLPDGESYEVVGTNVVAGARGAVFFTEVDTKKKNTYVCACNGEVTMQAANPKSFDQVVRSPNRDHNAFTFITKGKRQIAKKAPRKHHNDADAKLIMPFVDAVK